MKEGIAYIEKCYHRSRCVTTLRKKEYIYIFKNKLSYAVTQILFERFVVTHRKLQLNMTTFYYYSRVLYTTPHSRK